GAAAAAAPWASPRRRRTGRGAAQTSVASIAIRIGVCSRVAGTAPNRGEASTTQLIRHAPIRGRVGAKDQQFPPALDFSSDFDWLGDEVEDLLVHRLGVAGDEQESKARDRSSGGREARAEFRR